MANEYTKSLKEELTMGQKFIIHWDEKKLDGRRHVDKQHEYMAVVLVNVITGMSNYICFN